MFSNADRSQFISDLTVAAKDQDGRAISRLADHGLDLGITDEATARKITSLGEAIYQSTREDAKVYELRLLGLIGRMYL